MGGAVFLQLPHPKMKSMDLGLSVRVKGRAVRVLSRKPAYERKLQSTTPEVQHRRKNDGEWNAAEAFGASD